MGAQMAIVVLESWVWVVRGGRVALLVDRAYRREFRRVYKQKRKGPGWLGGSKLVVNLLEKC